MNWEELVECSQTGSKAQVKSCSMILTLRFSLEMLSPVFMSHGRCGILSRLVVTHSVSHITAFCYILIHPGANHSCLSGKAETKLQFVANI